MCGGIRDFVQCVVELECVQYLAIIDIKINWGEPKRAPH